MATTKKKLESQPTFESSADLLDNEEQLDNDVEPQVVKPSPVWNCRAVHWPPHSWKTTVQSGLAYVQSPYLIMEVLLLGAFLLLCYILPDYLVAAHQRPIPIQTTSMGEHLIDLTFANDYHHNETIPGSLLNLLCVVLPISVFSAVGILFGPRGDVHANVCMYVLTMATKIFVVACIKNYAGYLRPSFYNMCQFNSETLLCDDETTSARESFPSGHAATALSSMTLLALFLLGKVRGSTRQRGVKEERQDDDDMWTPNLFSKVFALMAVSPVFLGMFIATSRVRDNWHHPADVVCGGLIGIGCALFAHGLWFPSVYSRYAGIPLATVETILAERKKLKAAPIIDLDEESEL